VADVEIYGQGFFSLHNRTLLLCLIDDIMSTGKSPEIFLFAFTRTQGSV